MFNMFFSWVPQITSIKSQCATPAFLLRTFSLVFAIICGVTPVQADQSQSFVWVADTRSTDINNPINTSVFNPIMNSILGLNPAPKVVIFGGDASFVGGTANLTTFKTLFTDRLDAAGIPSAFAIGNHELYVPPTNTELRTLAGQQQFQALFNSNWIQNGPTGGAYNNLAFSFHLGNSLFIVADSIYAPSDGSTPDYGTDLPQRNWIQGLLQNNTAAHSFVLTHVPALVPSIPSANPKNPDIWQTITTSGNATNTNASILFTGHEHLYYRTLQNGTYEVLSGSAGAPLKCEKTPCGAFYPGDVYALQFNFTVVTIDGRYVNVNVFDQANHTLDAFRFFDNSGVNSATINNTTAIAPGPLEQQPSGILAGSFNTITNSAPISNVFTGIDAVNSNSITNSGSIMPMSGGNGIHVYDNNTITNTATGSITGNSTGLWGISVNSGNTVVNNGTIGVSGTNSVAFLAQGDNNTFTNNGILRGTGTGSYAARFLGTGSNTLINNGTLNGTLDIGLTTLNVDGPYTRGADSTLMATVNGSSSGSIVATGIATVNAANTLALNVSNYVPNNTTYKIIQGAVGGNIAAPIITTLGNNVKATFTATTAGDELILTSNRTANGFASDANPSDANARAAGVVLDNVHNPSTDMSNVLNTMEGLSKPQVASALDTLVPEVDAGVINNDRAMLNNFTGVSIDRVEKAHAEKQSKHPARSGISSGEAGKLDGLWAKGYGSYLTQGMRGGIAGYNAWNAGTALGVDRRLTDAVTLGISGGYAYGNVNSDANGANTTINSAQTTLYGGYQDQKRPFFIDTAVSFAYNWYAGRRNINVGNIILGTANGSYSGQQYGAYLGGGYKFKFADAIEVTPLVSLQYNNLHINSYGETGAGALNLNAGTQNYNQLQSGLGGRIATTLHSQWGKVTPELHSKWLYDFFGDPFAVTSNFNGGGAAFGSNGAKPAVNSFNVGGELKLDLRDEIALIGKVDTQLREGFTGVYGSFTVRF